MLTTDRPTTDTPTSNVFIHRHCMQQLLHEAITDEHYPCCGLLTGNGNIVTNCLPVTKNLIAANMLSTSNRQQDSLLGIYLATDNKGEINARLLSKLHAIRSQHQINTPFYSLIINLDHKGRIDARMYADEQLDIAITLCMQEDDSNASAAHTRIQTTVKT